MKYMTEQVVGNQEAENLASEIMTFIGENYQDRVPLVRSLDHFFSAWANQNPFASAKVMTARDDAGIIQSCVVALVMPHPIFVSKPIINKIVDINRADSQFIQYVDIVLGSIG